MLSHAYFDREMIPLLLRKLGNASSARPSIRSIRPLKILLGNAAFSYLAKTNTILAKNAYVDLFKKE